METRSRKRAEAFLAAPSSPSSGPTTCSSKRARLSSSSSTFAAATATTSLSFVNTCSRASRTKEQPLPPKNPPPMDFANESFGSRRDRRSKDNCDKGREKEHDVRIRDRDADKGLTLNMDGVGEDDDNDNEGGVGILHQNLTSASSALQGLLRKLGAGLDDLLPSSAMVICGREERIV